MTFLIKRIAARVIHRRVCYFCEEIKKPSDLAFMLHYHPFDSGICQDCAAEAS